MVSRGCLCQECLDELINTGGQVGFDGLPERCLAALFKDCPLIDKSVLIALLFLRSENDYTIPQTSS